MNPVVNALSATLYIVLIVSVMDTLASSSGPEETILIPMTMLSLFVLSAAVMGLLFVYKPLQLYLDNRRQEAFHFFVKTIGTFACLTLILATLLLTFH